MLRQCKLSYLLWIIILLKIACFEFRKWTYNNFNFLLDMTNKEEIYLQVFDPENDITNILGLTWDIENDMFECSVNNTK